MSQSKASPQFFKTPLTPAYWRLAALEVKNLRMIALTALFVGLRVILSGVFIPVGDNLRIAFSFFINALGCSLCGAILGLWTFILLPPLLLGLCRESLVLGYYSIW